MSGTTPGGTSSGFNAAGILKGLGLSNDQIAAAMSKFGTTTTKKTVAKKPPKSGIFVRTEESGSMPDQTTLQKNINSIFQNYYNRDATPDELNAYLPQAIALYKDPKTGQSKSYIQETYNNGVLTDTKVLTAQKADPTAFLNEKIKAQVAAGKVAVNEAGIPEGPAGKYFVDFKQQAKDHGIPLSDDTAREYADKVAAGVLDPSTVLSNIRSSSASLFPQFAEQIKSGTSLKTLADPYIQTMSNILEIPASGIDLYDNTIKSALNFTGPDGKPSTKSLYDFEQQLRSDPRWNYTDNARKSLDNVGYQVLKNFGLAN